MALEDYYGSMLPPTDFRPFADFIVLRSPRLLPSPFAPVDNDSQNFIYSYCRGVVPTLDPISEFSMTPGISQQDQKFWENDLPDLPAINYNAEHILTPSTRSVTTLARSSRRTRPYPTPAQARAHHRQPVDDQGTSASASYRETDFPTGYNLNSSGHNEPAQSISRFNSTSRVDYFRETIVNHHSRNSSSSSSYSHYSEYRYSSGQNGVASALADNVNDYPQPSPQPCNLQTHAEQSTERMAYHQASQVTQTITLSPAPDSDQLRLACKRKFINPALRTSESRKKKMPTRSALFESRPTPKPKGRRNEKTWRMYNPHAKKKKGSNAAWPLQGEGWEG